MNRRFSLLCVFAALLTVWTIETSALRARAAEGESALPKVGDKAKDFTLKTLAGDEVKLGELTKQGPLVLVMLRGYPGYQCPICSRQVGSLLGSADAIAESGAKVLLVYPWPAAELDAKAKEFLGKRMLPDISCSRPTRITASRWPTTCVGTRRGKRPTPRPS